MASSLAAEIENKFGVKPELVPGHGGIYEVVVDGEIVFTNHSEGHIPEHEEVLQKIQQH